MPKPNKGESEKHYVGRFMGSKESQRSFPNKKQRLAVAYALGKLVAMTLHVIWHDARIVLVFSA